MDLNKWCNLKSEPSLKHLTEAGFGVPKKKQRVSVQELVKAHIESFDQAVTDGLCRVVEGEVQTHTHTHTQQTDRQTDRQTHTCLYTCRFSTDT